VEFREQIGVTGDEFEALNKLNLGAAILSRFKKEEKTQ
jgi:hypothetical protein